MDVKVIQLGTQVQSTMAEDQDVPKLLGGEYVKVTQGTQVQSVILEDQDAQEDGYGKITQENQVQSKMSRTPDQVLPKLPDGGYGWLVVFGCILQWVLIKMKLLSFLIFAGVIALSFARANKATTGGKFAIKKYKKCNKI